MQWITNHNYDFSHDKDIQDKTPDWLDTLCQDIADNKHLKKTASINNIPKKVNKCKHCRAILKENEVVYCSKCSS